MRNERVWGGRFPKFWDVTTWAILINNHVVNCYRDPLSNRRMFEIMHLLDKSKKVTETIYNAIIGCLDQIIYFALVADARSHIQISRLAAYNIQTGTFEWKTNETFLIEKYRIPDINEYSKVHYILGNKQINLTNGNVMEYNLLKKYIWPIDDELYLVQNGEYLDCVDHHQKVIWSNEGYLGSCYQGIEGNDLVFMVTDNLIVLLDKWTGTKKETIDLPDLKIISNRIAGSLNSQNDKSSDNSSIADVLMNEEVFVWLNLENNILVKTRSTGNITKYEIMGHELYLSMIEKNKILLYDLHEEDYGDLLVFDIGG